MWDFQGGSLDLPKPGDAVQIIQLHSGLRLKLHARGIVGITAAAVPSTTSNVGQQCIMIRENRELTSSSLSLWMRGVKRKVSSSTENGGCQSYVGEKRYLLLEGLCAKTTWPSLGNGTKAHLIVGSYG